MTIRFRTLALISLCLTLTLAGCGRKGALEGPDVSAAPQGAAADPADAQATAAPESEDEPFFLDFLIN